MLYEVSEELEFTRGQFQGLALAKRLRGAKVDSHIAELNDLTGSVGRNDGRTPQQRFEAGEQFRHFKGFGHVVIGAEFQSQDFVHKLALRGKHQEGCVDAALAQVTAYVEAAAMG